MRREEAVVKTILILRHAKSDWSNLGKADFDRPLAKRGLEDAPRMGRVLALFDCVPDKIIASPARRAKQTAEMVAKACGYQQAIQWEEIIYGGDHSDLITILQQLPNRIERPLLIGHNPTLETMVTALCTTGNQNRGENHSEAWHIKIPTAGLVCLNMNLTDWATLGPGQGVLHWFLIPKLVKAIQVNG